MKRILLLLSLSVAWLRAELTIAPVFTDHMVLQRDVPLPVWGRAAPGASVTVEFAGNKKTAVADVAGRWLVRLGPQAASAAARDLRINAAGESREITDVLVGEVWLCAGQSNMEWPLARELHAEAELPRASHPGIRFFNPGYVGKEAGGRPFAAAEMAMLTRADYYRGTWEVCTPGSAARMSAIGYYAARDLHAALGLPIGIIHLAVGGSPAEAWVSREALAGDSALRALTEGDWLVNPALEVWCRQRGQENLGPAPAGGAGGPDHPFKPGFLWDAGIKPLLPFGLRGVMWYQGESNSLSLARVRQHEILLPLLVHDWRQGWGRPDLPFLYCQLSGIDANPYRSEFWPEFRDSQRRLLEAIPYTGMVVTADVGNRTDVHPRDKATVGARLARLALTQVYGRELESGGPLPKSARVRGNDVVVTFTHVIGGLRASDGQALRGFEIVAADNSIIPAHAMINGVTVLLSYQAGITPRRIRYGWQPFPEGNLENGASLPASTFVLDASAMR